MGSRGCTRRRLRMAGSVWRADRRQNSCRIMNSHPRRRRRFQVCNKRGGGEAFTANSIPEQVGRASERMPSKMSASVFMEILKKNKKLKYVGRAAEGGVK